MLVGNHEIDGMASEGPLRGVLRLPPPELDVNSETYFKVISIDKAISFTEIRDAISKNGYQEGKEITQFTKQITRVFANAIRWHSRGRWVPDTVGDLDPNACSEVDIEKARTRPFITASESETRDRRGSSVFTIEKILEYERIPSEFLEITFQENAKDYKNLTSATKTQLDYSTSILLPHRCVSP